MIEKSTKANGKKGRVIKRPRILSCHRVIELFSRPVYNYQIISNFMTNKLQSMI